MSNDYLVDVPQETLKELYAQAYAFYEHGHYQKASDFFRVLTMMSPDTGKYWLGLAACAQMMKEYEEAIQGYSMAALLDEDEKNPFPHLYASQCFISLENIELGLQALKSAEIVAKKDQKYENLISHIKLLKEIWSSKK